MTEDSIIISTTMWWSYVGLCNVNSPDNYIFNNQAHLNKWQSITLNRYPSLISIRLVSVWEVNFVLFNSMLKYVINRLMHAFFHIRTVIIPQPISTLGLKPSGRYRSLGMITVLKCKKACINL
jgi:hypothetical protein